MCTYATSKISHSLYAWKLHAYSVHRRVFNNTLTLYCVEFCYSSSGSIANAIVRHRPKHTHKKRAIKYAHAFIIMINTISTATAATISNQNDVIYLNRINHFNYIWREILHIYEKKIRFHCIGYCCCCCSGDFKLHDATKNWILFYRIL